MENIILITVKRHIEMDIENFVDTKFSHFDFSKQSEISFKKELFGGEFSAYLFIKNNSLCKKVL